MPRPDQIPKKILKVIMPKISNHLEQIFNDFFSIGYYLAYFKESIIVILHKQGGIRDFTNSKSYQLINLFNMVRKIMEIVLAARISYMAITHNLLLKTHFRDRCGLYIETAIHYLLEIIYTAWNKNKIASLLMIDVSVAYPNTFHQRLLYNLHKKKMDIKVVCCIALFLTNCQTIVKINKHIMLKLSIDLSFLQDLPLSSILYFFYNKNLFNNCAKKRVDIQGYIYDITFIVISKSIKSNN